MGRHATCAVQLPANYFLELSERALEVVVDDPVVELGLELQLALRDGEPLVDLPFALGRTCAESMLELLLARRRHEDRYRPVDAVADGERAIGLDLATRTTA